MLTLNHLDHKNYTEPNQVTGLISLNSLQFDNIRYIAWLHGTKVNVQQIKKQKIKCSLTQKFPMKILL